MQRGSRAYRRFQQQRFGKLLTLAGERLMVFQCQFRMTSAGQSFNTPPSTCRRTYGVGLYARGFFNCFVSCSERHARIAHKTASRADVSVRSCRRSGSHAGRSCGVPHSGENPASRASSFSRECARRAPDDLFLAGEM